jgi:hypothetical protein
LSNSWRDLQFNWFNDAFTIDDNVEHIRIGFIGNPSDVQLFKKHLCRLHDDISRYNNFMEIREAVSRMGLKFSLAVTPLPGYIDDAEGA